MSLDDLVREMSGTRVLGGGRIGEATDVVAEIFRDPSYTNFLTIAGPMDSILGFSLWSFAQTEVLQLNPITDVTKIVEMAMTADKIGVVILGGGLPKHHTLLASVLREGVDRAVQITSDHAEPGGLSGAPLAESISWRKIRKGGKFVDVYGDATVCFPLIVGAVLDRVKKRNRTLKE